MKRVLLFLGTNLAILLVLSTVVQLLGLDRYLTGTGGLDGLLVFAAIFGFGGAFLSLALSKWMAKRSMGVQVIAQPRDATERWLVETVRHQAARAGIGMPEVGIFQSPQPNAFATGASRNKALVAVSTGLLQKMDRGEVEAVLAHEVSHVANGDMVTLTLIQGVVNTFVIFIARIIGNTVDRALSRDEESSSGVGPAYFVTVIVAELVLGVLASIIVMWFSRQREFRADAGGARLAGRERMIGALEVLRRQHEIEALPKQFSAFGILGGGGGGLKRLFMSHPPIEERIAVLQRAGSL